MNARVLHGHPKLLEEVLCHELAHVAAYELYGKRCRPHGPEWAGLMRTAGFEPCVRARMSRDGQTVMQAAGTVRALYEHRCPVCQAMRLARRSVPQWRCVSCAAAGLEGKLVIAKRMGRRQ